MTTQRDEQLEVLRSLDATIAALQERHERQKSYPWVPSQLIPKERTAVVLPNEILAMLVLNLLTEEGLPHYVALIARHIGQEGAFWQWTLRWTAEEDFHGLVLRDMLKGIVSNEQMQRVEKAQFDFQCGGFQPSWTLPYELLAYVVLQERATQISHHGIQRLLREHDQQLAHVLALIGADEARHHTFYFNLFKEVIRADPSAAVCAFHSAFSKFSMPGANVPGFRALSEVQERMGVFGRTEFCALTRNVVGQLQLHELSGLSPEADSAREKLMRGLEILGRAAERGRNLTTKKTVPLPILGEGVSVTL